jgi:hypothetical protein
MGKLLLNPRRPLLRIKINSLNYRKVQALLASVIANLTLNVGTFPTPSPTVIELTALQTALQSALNGLGTKKNKGSHAQVLAAKEASLAAKNGLVLALGYVQTTIALNAPPAVVAAQLALAGFAFRKVKGLLKGGAPQMVSFLRQTNNRTTPYINGQLKWRKPLGSIKGSKLAGYRIYQTIGTAPEQYFGTVTKTSALVTTPALGTPIVYRIVPFSSRGEGVSMSITVK